MLTFPADFYATTAQLIALLFVLVAIEFGMLSRDVEAERTQAAAVAALAATLLFVTTGAIGETAALVALAREHGTAAEDQLIIATIVVNVAIALVLAVGTVAVTAAKPSVKSAIERADSIVDQARAEVHALAARQPRIPDELKRLSAETEELHKRADAVRAVAQDMPEQARTDETDALRRQIEDLEQRAAALVRLNEEIQSMKQRLDQTREDAKRPLTSGWHRSWIRLAEAMLWLVPVLATVVPLYALVLLAVR